MVAAAALLFALEAIFTKIAYGAGVNVTTTLALRFIPASIVLVIVSLSAGQGLYIPKKHILFFSLLTSLYIGISITLYLAYKLLPASLAIMFFYLYPAFTAVLSFYINGEKLSRAKIAAILLSLIGLALLLGSSFQQASLAGIVFALCAAVLNGLDLALFPKMLSRIHQLTFITWTFLCSAIVFGSYGLISGGLNFHFAPAGWLSLLGLSLFSTAGSTLALVYGLNLVGSTLTAIINTLEPPVTVILAVLIFGERLYGWQIIGAILVIVAILLPQINLSGKKPAD